MRVKVHSEEMKIPHIQEVSVPVDSQYIIETGIGVALGIAFYYTVVLALRILWHAIKTVWKVKIYIMDEYEGYPNGSERQGEDRKRKRVKEKG